MDIVLSYYKLWLAVASVLIGGLAAAPYMVSILIGKTQPPYSTYIGWSLIGITATFFQIQAVQAGENLWSVIPVAAFGGISLTILTIMFKARVPWTCEARDKISFLGIGVSWLVWVTTHYWGSSSLLVLPLLALAMTDGFSSWPTFQDCRLGKQSSPLERTSWTMTAIAALCGLAAVAEFGTLEVFIPLYVAFYMCAIAAASIFGTPEKKVADNHASLAE